VTDQAATKAVYALARTQLDWIPAPPPTLAPRSGFVAAIDEAGRQLRYLACPDCLTNGKPMFGCETCGGRGEIPDSGRDPYETSSSTLFGGVASERAADKARAIDAQLIRLRQLERARAGDPAALPEDWLTRALRLKAQQWKRGDYPLLEAWQEILGYRFPMRHFAWVTFVVEEQPLSVASAARVRLDETAAWLADRMLSTIHRQIAAGVKRSRELRVPHEHQEPADPAEAGKGRWANGWAQGQRNATVVGLAAEGKTAGEIARQVGVTKRRVQQLLAEAQAAGAASGPAA
jgi:hypothetical protein